MTTDTYDQGRLKKITLGFKPKFLAIVTNGASGSESNADNGSQRYIYNEDFSTTYFHRAVSENSVNYINSRVIGQNIGFASLETDGFVFRTDISQSDEVNAIYYYFAIG